MPFDAVASAPKPDPSQITQALKDVYLDGQQTVGKAIAALSFCHHGDLALTTIKDLAQANARIAENLLLAARLIAQREGIDGFEGV